MRATPVALVFALGAVGIEGQINVNTCEDLVEVATLAGLQDVTAYIPPAAVFACDAYTTVAIENYQLTVLVRTGEDDDYSPFSLDFMSYSFDDDVDEGGEIHLQNVRLVLSSGGTLLWEPSSSFEGNASVTQASPQTLPSVLDADLDVNFCWRDLCWACSPCSRASFTLTRPMRKHKSDTQGI